MKPLFSLCQGRLLDSTKNYTYVFLLAGIEVVVSALVLAICNLLFIKQKPEAPETAIENAETVEAKNHSSTPPTEEPHTANGNSEKRAENVMKDPEEEETFLKDKDEQKNIACSPETDLWWTFLLKKRLKNTNKRSLRRTAVLMCVTV